MDPLTSPALRAAAAALVTAVATGTLSCFARRWGSGKWPALSALLLGPGSSSEPTASEVEKGDLRFAAVVASVSAGLAWVVALDQVLRGLSPSGRAAGIALGFPAIALAVTALADAIARREELAQDFLGEKAESESESETESVAVEDTSVPSAITGILPAGTQDALRAAIQAGGAVASTVATAAKDPRVQAAASAAAGAAMNAAVSSGSAMLDAAASVVAKAVASQRPSASLEERDRVRKLIDDALGEVGVARARTSDDAIQAALASMEEALAGYAQVVDEPDADLERIAIRCREVMALAASCEDDGADAFRVLGLKRDATLDQAKRVYRDLARIYHADASAQGVDSGKFKEITVAYERVRTSLESRVAA